jgi:hypothetical protein
MNGLIAEPLAAEEDDDTIPEVRFVTAIEPEEVVEA